MKRLPEPEPDDWSLLGRIESAIGRDLTLRLCSAVGGTEVALSEYPRRGSLVEAIGVDAARKLYDELGGGKIIIPMGVHAGLARRRHEATELAAKGLSQAQIARKLGVHVRTLARWANS